MELTIQARNLELDEATRDYVARKLQRVDRHINGVRLATVQLGHEATRRVDQRFSAQITLDVNGSVLRSEERGATPRAAIDIAADVVDRRVQRLKGRVYRSERARHSGASIRYEAPPQEEAPSEAEDREGKVVRVKRFPIKPMTLDEAMFQMEMLGHDFFLFLNTEGRQYQLLYRREDGDYGLIVPEML